MKDIERIMWDAWDKVRPRLEKDPDELRARLARRRLKSFQHPPRDCCIAIRANDRRINDATAIIEPRHAVDVHSPEHRGKVEEHKVTLTKSSLVRLHGSVFIMPPGQTLQEVAGMLGCSEAGLRKLRKNGFFKEHFVKGLMGRRGKPVPLLYTDKFLDPCAAGKRTAHPMFSAMWSLHADSLDEDFKQTIWRVPVLASMGGPLRFVCWKWICPGCKKPVRTLYLPTAPPDWGKYVQFAPGLVDVEAVPEPARCFACGACHHVRQFSRTNLVQFWSDVVLYFSGGLMYGREVERPDWVTMERRQEKVSRPRKLGAPRRELLTTLLAGESTLREIAWRMLIKLKSVQHAARKIYRQYGAKDREGFRLALAGEKGEMKAAG